MNRKDEAINKLQKEAQKLDTKFTDIMARQISEMIKTDDDAEKILNSEKSIAECKKSFDAYASKQKKGGQSVIGPDEAEKLIKEYFELDSQDIAVNNHKTGGEVIDIMDFI